MPLDHDRLRHGYIGRFAPSPSGPLHEGSLVTAMASYLDARAHKGRWLLRIEDIDTPRIVTGAGQRIMQQLQALGMQWDGVPLWQSQRITAYQSAFDSLMNQGYIYGCKCSRQETQNRPYPGTCRSAGLAGQSVRAWRFMVPEGVVRFDDRWQGPQQQNVADQVGDFILKRADGLWAYQLAVVVDDAFQHITHIVRGADLLSSTARQHILANQLGLNVPSVMHIPVVLDLLGNKVSKQNHAPALDCAHPMQVLNLAWQRLGFEALVNITNCASFWHAALPKWAARFKI